MKYIVLFLLIAYVLIKTTVTPLWECDIKTIKQAIPPILWYEQTIDGPNQPPLITRFLHNKANIFMSQFAKCYAHKLEPLEVYRTIGAAGLVFWLYFIYMIALKKLWLWIFIFLITPFILIFQMNTNILDFSYKFFAIIGGIFFISKKNK